MRFSLGLLASAAALFTFGAIGLLGVWALVAGTIVGLVGAVATVIVMEEREHADALVIALADRRRPVVTTTPIDGVLEVGSA
jgi:hypothetical protein